ncbi:MAG: ferrochelatase [Deltaproteobacteria bacterium]
MSDKTAVLLLQMGGPDSLDAVGPFLLNLFSDRDIIRLGPAFLHPFLARRISRKRTPEVERQYEKIGGRSPIREMTENQAQALEEKLGDGFRCFVAMRYWRPSTIEALAAINRGLITRIVALPLYPHYSRATTGSSLNELKRVLREAGVKFELSCIEPYYNHHLYIGALAERIAEGLTRFPDRKDLQVVFSAHSLPQSFIDAGDPYLSQIVETVRLVMEHFIGVTHRLAFQSRAGPLKWLEPDTEKVIRELAANGCSELLIVPISFVSDHLETLYEIDLCYRELAHSLGICEFHRAPALNCSPLFIESLADLVREKVAESLP